MRPFELSSWNVEHGDDTRARFEGTARSGRRQSMANMPVEARAKLAAIAAEIDPDILFVCENLACGPCRAPRCLE